MKKYITTKEQCQTNIDIWQNVCTNCGEELSPMETVDNSNQPTYWVGCESCNIFNNGTKKHIYNIAVKMVDERNFTAYNYDEKPDKAKDLLGFNYWRRGQIGGTVHIVQDVLNLDKNSIYID